MTLFTEIITGCILRARLDCKTELQSLIKSTDAAFFAKFWVNILQHDFSKTADQFLIEN